VVLILGRFTDERKAILAALRHELRLRNDLPILFDFDQPVSCNLTETVTLLARMAHFVVAAPADSRGIPQEPGVIIPHQPSVLVRPLLQDGADLYAMFESWLPYPWSRHSFRRGRTTRPATTMRLVGATNTPCRELGKTRREAIRTLERFLVRTT
jgi:hypothetical protein